MAANTKQIKGDVDRKPSPQYYNPVADEYEYLYGENGASRHILYSSDGQPITSSGNKLAVRASEIETLLSDIKSKDFATQTTLAQILAKIIAAPATEAKQTALNALIGEVQAAPTANTLLARLKSLEDKINEITAGTTPANVQLSGSNLVDTQAIPTKPVTKLVMLANAEAFTDAVSKTYDLKAISGLSYEDIRKYRRFRFTFYNTHDKAATVSLGATVPARAEIFYGPAFALYKEDNNLLANYYLIVQGQAGGTGITSTIKIVPALTDGIYSDFYIQIKFNEAPTTGALSIACEMGV